MSEPIIQDNPPKDGKQYDCQCARCGSSIAWELCSNCGGEGYYYEDDEGGTEETFSCEICEGTGTWPLCLSSKEWCVANPIKGRENINRGKVEWFPI